MKLNDNPFIELLPQLTIIAEKYLLELNMPVGTYTALEIDRVLRQLIKNYRLRTRQCLAGIKNMKEMVKVSGNQNLYRGDYAPIDLITVTAGDFTLRFPLMAIFYVLWKIEIVANLTINKRHKFKIMPVGKFLAEGTVEFMGKKVMGKLARLVKSYNSIAFLDFIEGIFHFKNDIVEHILKLEDFNFKLDGEVELNIPLDVVGKLFGKCDVKVYRDNKTGKSFLVFQNSSGDIISNYRFISGQIEVSEKMKQDLKKATKIIKTIASQPVRPQFIKTSLF